MDAHETVTSELTRQERILLAEYQEVCKSHAGITDFRAKLLALLPIASGVGIGLLVSQGNGELSKTGAGLLVALGIFGAAVTIGLFLYELRQIDVCKQLRTTPPGSRSNSASKLTSAESGAPRPYVPL